MWETATVSGSPVDDLERNASSMFSFMMWAAPDTLHL